MYLERQLIPSSHDRRYDNQQYNREHMIEFIGRLHPVLVHLPIGIFVVALLMDLMSRKSRFNYLEQVLTFVYSVGVLGGILSLISGYYLSLEEGNSSESISLHKWVAIATTLLFAGYTLFRTRFTGSKLLHLASLLVLLAAIIGTGHLGGSLTHGEHYLLGSTPETGQMNTTVEIANIQEAVVYRDVVQHTLNVKCVQCHGADRQKGRLRLDNIEWLEKGGKHGAVLDKNNPENSELIKRILLEMNDEYHMPPKDKTQLTDFEMDIMKWWAKTGASYDQTVSALMPDEKAQKALGQFTQYYAPQNASVQKTRSPVKALDDDTKKELEKSGWVITPVSQTDHHLRITGFNLETPVTSALQQLQKANVPVIELKLSGTKLKDGDLSILASFSLLEKLWLDHNELSDESVQQMGRLKNLEYLNITNTKIGVSGIKELLAIPSLQTVYLPSVTMTEEETDALIEKHKKIQIHFGKDTMIKVPTDTLFVKKTTALNG